MIEVKVKRLHRDALLPKTWSEHAVGLDLHAFLLTADGRPNTLIIGPNNTRRVPTALSAEPPPGYYLTVWSRSGIARQSLFVANSPGLIDPDYRGEIEVLLYNGGHTSHYVKHEDRIAQLVAIPYTAVSIREAESLSESLRNEVGT